MNTRLNMRLWDLISSSSFSLVGLVVQKLSCSDGSLLHQDFIAGLMKMEESKAKEIQKHISSNDPSGTSPTATGDQDRPDTSDSTASSYLSTLTKEDLCNPVIFVRKWIGEVSISITLFS